MMSCLQEVVGMHFMAVLAWKLGRCSNFPRTCLIIEYLAGILCGMNICGQLCVTLQKQCIRPSFAQSGSGKPVGHLPRLTLMLKLQPLGCLLLCCTFVLKNDLLLFLVHFQQLLVSQGV